jgi:hypothetical protein
MENGKWRIGERLMVRRRFDNRPFDRMRLPSFRIHCPWDIARTINAELPKGASMPKVQVERQTHRALVEENWWDGTLGYEKVDVHCKVYRCDCGQHAGQYCAEAHIHKPGGGRFMTSGGAPNMTNRTWFGSKDEAVDRALRRLEERDDVHL